MLLIGVWLKSTRNAVVVQPDLASPFAAEFDEAIVLGTRSDASHSSAKYYMSKTLPVIVRGS